MQKSPWHTPPHPPPFWSATPTTATTRRIVPALENVIRAGGGFGVDIVCIDRVASAQRGPPVRCAGGAVHTGARILRKIPGTLAAHRGA